MVEAYGEEQDPVVLQRTQFQPNWRQGQVTSRTQIRYLVFISIYNIYLDATRQFMIKDL